MSITRTHAMIRRPWKTIWSLLAAVALTGVVAAQDAPPPEQKQEAGQPQDDAARRPARTKGRTTPKRPPRGGSPQEPPAGEQPPPGEEEMSDEQLQKEVQELLKNQQPGQEMDPAVQKRIEDLLQRKARNAKRGAGEQAGQVQPVGQAPTQQPVQTPPGDQAQGQPPPDPSQPQPAQPTTRPSPREAARQRAEERRKQQQEQQRQQQEGQPPSDTPNEPPLPPPAQSFQPQPIETPPSGPTTQINIPPDESEQTPLEERSFSFSIKNGTYEQLIEGFARQTGLGVMGEIPQGGTVNFVSTEEWSFKEALSRVQMQLFNYKPHEPYWILHTPGGLQVIRVTDLYRIIPKERVFPSLDAYRAANLSEDEIALVFFTPKSGSIGDLMIARDFLPDYVRITPLQDQNGVAIFALVKDIERYLDFIQLVSAGAEGGDARNVERIPLVNIPASDALNKLNQLMGPMDVGGRPMNRPVRTGPATGLEGVPEPAVSIIADDEQNVLIVRAVPKTIEEIKRLLPFIDVSGSGDAPPPFIIALKHTTADAIVPVIQQMMSNPGAIEAAVKAAPVPERRTRRTGRTQPAGGGAVATESVMLIPHPSGQAIIVTANTDADITAVRKLVEMVDVPSIVEWVHIPVSNNDPETVREGVEDILGTIGAMPKQPGEQSGFQIFADPRGNGIWFSGSEKDLDRVRAVVEKLDVVTDAATLHRVHLEYQTPTFVANMLREMEGAAAAVAAAPAATPQEKAPMRGGSRRGVRRSTAPAAPGKFTPDDPSGLLYILCTEVEWKHYQEIIKQLDAPAVDGPPFVRIALQHAEAESAVEKLSAMIGANPDALASEIRLVPANRAILVLGAGNREIERLQAFLKEVDLPEAIEQRTFVIQHADPGEIKTLVEAFIADSPEGAARPRRSARQVPPRNPEGGAPQPAGVTPVEPVIDAVGMTIVQLGNKLIVRASPDRLDAIGKLVAEFDVPGGGTEIRVYQDFPPSADIEYIANTIESVVTGAPPGTRRGGAVPQPGGGTATASPKFIPQPTSGRLVVVASPTDFPRIEELLQVLRYEVKGEQFLVEFVPVQFADPDELVAMIQPVLEIKVRGLMSTGELTEPAMIVEDPAGGGAPVPAARRRAQLGGGGGADKTSDKYHLSPDARNKRIVVAAPRLVVEEVRTLVGQFDLPGGAPNEVVFRTVELQNTAPAEMIQAVKEMMGKPQASRVNRVKRATGQAGAPAPAPAAPTGEAATGESLTIVEAPGGGAIVLHGVLADVEQATEWIHKLDTMASAGRVIRAYKVDYADVGKMFDLIVNVLDSSPAAAPPANRPAARQAPRGPATAEATEEKEEDEEFATSKTHSTGDLYIHADLIGRTMLVATTQAKINQIEGVLNQFKADEEIKRAMDQTPSVPQKVIDLLKADAEVAQYTFDDVMDALWIGDEKPQAEAAGFGNALIVKYPDESRFPEIIALIQERVDIPNEEKLSTRRKMVSTPQGAKAAMLAEFLRNNIPADIEIEIDNKTPEEKDSENKYDVQELGPRKRAGGAPCVLPGGMERMSQQIVGLLLAYSQDPPPEEEEEEQPAEEEPAPEEQAEPEPVKPAPLTREQRQERSEQDRMIRELAPQNPPAVVPIGQQTQPPATEEEAKPSADASRLYEGKKLRIIYNDETGKILLEGPKGIIEDIDDILKDFEETIKDQEPPPDIRIVQVEYIDVYSAQDIIEEMFNATRQQRQEYQNLQRQQQQQQQMLARQQQQQMRQAGQGRGTEDEKQRQQQQQQQQQEQMQQQMQLPQLPPTSVRVYPNPRDRTLILRADTRQYEEIYKLLATIDQPKPFDSSMRVYPLKKLSAKEVEEFLRDALNLNQGGGASRRTARMGAGAAGEFSGEGPSIAPGSSLPRTILGKTSGGINQLGIDPEDIKLFASEANNSIMVVAPKEALDYIGEIITNLESGDIPNRVTKYYQLLHASAQDVVDYLGTHFGESGKRERAPRAEGPAPAAASAGGGTPNAPTFIAYPQLNLLTVQAIEPQIPEIEDIIKRLDVETGESWRDVRVMHVNAAGVAETLTQMFGEGGPAGSRPGGGPASASGKAKFIGEDGGNIILFSAPQNMHQEILDTIAKLDKDESKDKIRVIELQFAVPSTVAEAIDRAYQESGGSARRGGGGSSAGKGFTITAHDPSGRLFIKASDSLFAELESLVKSLDHAGDMPEFRIYPLQHANAKAVHAQMTKLMQEYMQRMGKGAGGIAEPFSVQVDETANALIALGGPTVFGFLEENLRKIDTPAAGTGKLVSETIALQFNDAAEVAGNLQRMYQGRELPEGVSPPQIEANRQNNTLIIRATADQIAEMRSTVIQPLEAQDPNRVTGTPIETIRLTYADPASVADAIGRLFRSDGRNPRDEVTATPELGANAILVAAYPHNMQRVKNLIAQIDIEDAVDDGVHVVELRYADPEAVARTLNEIYVRTAAQRGGGGGQTSQLSISAVPGSQALVVRAGDTEFKHISNTIQELDIEGVGIGEEVRMITLSFADAGEVHSALQEYLRKAQGGRDQLAGDVRLTAMPQANAVMVAAKKEEVDRLERIIKNMDVAGEKGSVPQIIPLKYANASMMATSLEAMFSKPFGQAGRNYSPPVITADETGNFLIVRAMPSDFASIEGLITKMDTEDKKDQTPYRIIPVPAGQNVEDLAERVEESINQTAEARAAGVKGSTVPRLTVIPDRRTNSVTLAGSASLFADAAAMIKTFSEMGPAGGIQTRIVKVPNVSREEIDAIIQQLTEPPGGGESRGRRSPSRQPGASPGGGERRSRERQGAGRP